MWSNIESLETFAKWAAWIAAIAGFVAGISGVLAILADQRGKTLGQQLKKTPPRLDATLAFAEDGKIYFIIESHTQVPFECKWWVSTKNGKMVTGFPLDWTKVYPTPERTRFHQLMNIQFDQLNDSFLELRVEYRSSYAAELILPQLEGTIVHKYRLSEDQKSLLDIS